MNCNGIKPIPSNLAAGFCINAENTASIAAGGDMRIPDSQRIFLAGCFLASIVLSSSAFAQTYLEEYKAYNAALEANDAEGAIRHAYAAWRAAEEELGDDRLTAILAYNYGQQVLFSDTEKALPALRRADELRQAVLAELPDDLTLFLAYAEFIDSDGSRSKANDLRELLQSLKSNEVPPNADTVQMWLVLAKSDIENRRYRYAEESARNAENLLLLVSPDDYRSQATTIIMQGIARVAPRSRRKNDVQEAMALFKRAREMFPLQESIDDFDVVMAQAMAWEYAANAVFYSDRFRGKELPREEYQVFASPGKSLEECGIVWESREPKYPEDALKDRYVGAVVLGHRLGDDDRIHDARILAEVPINTFSEIVLESAKKWRLKAPPPDDPLCRKKFISMISFVIK